MIDYKKITEDIQNGWALIYLNEFPNVSDEITSIKNEENVMQSLRKLFKEPRFVNTIQMLYEGQEIVLSLPQDSTETTDIISKFEAMISSIEKEEDTDQQEFMTLYRTGARLAIVHKDNEQFVNQIYGLIRKAKKLLEPLQMKKIKEKQLQNRSSKNAKPKASATPKASPPKTSDNKKPRPIVHPFNKKEKLLLEHYLSPGDIVCMTALVRDLKLAHGDKYDIGVKTSTKELWEHNKHIDTTIDENTPDVKRIKVGYDTSINNSNEGSHSLVTGFHIDLEEKLNIRIPPTKHYGEVPLSNEEKSWISMINEHYTNEDTPYWLIFSGGKNDYTSKWWISDYAQEVVNHFKDKIQFVQCGQVKEGHTHPLLDGVIDIRNKTDMRQFVRVMYHAQGVVCPITLADHLSAAVPTRPDRPKRRACVTICGGREPHRYIDYTNHTTLHTNGMLDCCDNGGCWKSRTTPLGDGDKKDNELCVNTTEVNGKTVQKCMAMITPQRVIEAIEGYMQHSKMKYVNTTIEA